MNTDASLAFIDTETLGLDPYRHPIWEIAVIVDGVEHIWTQQLPLQRLDVLAEINEASDSNYRCEVWRGGPGRGLMIDSKIDPVTISLWAIENTGINDRYNHDEALTPADSMRQFAELTEGRFLVGSNPAFDEERLRLAYTAYVRPGATAMPWNYRAYDIGGLMLLRALDFWHGTGIGERPSPMWSTTTLSRYIGVPVPEGTDRHSALGDARWARDVWDKVMTWA